MSSNGTIVEINTQLFDFMCQTEPNVKDFEGSEILTIQVSLPLFYWCWGNVLESEMKNDLLSQQ